MKIFHPVLCYYPSQAGGPANTIYWLNKYLDAKLFSTEVISTTFGLIEDVKVKSYSSTHKVKFFSSKGKPFLIEGNRLLKTSGMVQFSSIFFPPTLPLLLLAIYHKKSVVISPRGELYDAAIRQKSVKKKIWIAIIKLFQKKINFHGTNNYEREIIHSMFPKSKSCTVIPNFIEMPNFLDKRVEDKIVFIGRINPIKNIHVLIEAFAQVHKVKPDVRLEIIGSARLELEKDYLRSLEEMLHVLKLEGVVNFLGHKEGEIKNEIISSSKALVLPSKSENFGNVVLEALAQGTPVIASKNTPWNLLNESNAGFWIEAVPNEISNVILKLFNLSESEYISVRKNAYNLCSTNFDIKMNTHVWENYYKKIIKNVEK